VDLLKSKIRHLLVAVCIVFTSQVSPAAGIGFPMNAETDAVRAEITASKAELAQAQDVLKKATAELNSAIAEDRKIKAELVAAQTQRDQILADIKILEDEIAVMQAQIDDLIRQTYIDGSQQELYLLEAILSSEDTNEALSTFNSLQSLLNSSSKIVKVLNEDRELLKVKEQELAQREIEISEKKVKSAELVALMASAKQKADNELERIKKIVAAKEALLKRLVLAGLSANQANFGNRVGPGNRVLGTDISRWQHYGNAPINFVKMYDAGMRFIFIKGTDSHPLGADAAKYWSRIDFPAAREAGLLTGIYHAALIPRGISSDAAFSAGQQQADLPIDHLNSLGGLVPGVLPIVLDIESFSRPSGTSATVVSNFTLGFTSRVRERTGKTPIIYSNLNFIRSYLTNSAIANNYLWIANYSRTTNPAAVSNGSCVRTIWSSSNCEINWTFWQYSDSGPGTNYGISRGGLDMNVFAFEPSNLLAMAGY